MPITNVRILPYLQFKDGSIYSGQVLDTSTLPTPHGYGVLTTPQNFSHHGHFQHGKAAGPGVFRAPNGDTFWGSWGAKDNKREGKGLFVRGSDGLQLVEEYKEGKMDKRVKRRPPPPTTRHWLASTSLDGGLGLKGQGPSARAGHSMNVNDDQTLLVIFGGETITPEGITLPLNDLHLLDLTTLTWLTPSTTGQPPPPLHHHTATLVHNQLIIIGGQFQGLDSNSSVYSLDLQLGQWSTLVTHSLPFASHTSTYIPSLHAILTLQHDKAFSFSLHTHQWTECSDDRRGLYRSPRSFIAHSAALHNDSLWVIGGKVMGGSVQSQGKAYEKCTGDVRVLHIPTMVWSVPSLSPSTAPFTTPRAQCQSVMVEGRWWVYGGYSTLNPALTVVDEVWLSSMVVLDVEKGVWEVVVTGLVGGRPRAEGGMVEVGGKMWVFGGRNAGEAAMGDWQVLDMGKGKGKAEGKKEESKEAISEGTSAFPVVVADDSVVGSGSVMDAFRAQQGL